MGRGLIPGTIWKISCHNLFITYFTLTFFKHLHLYGRKDLLTENKSSRELPLFNLSEICTMTLESVCKIYPRR